MPLERSLGNLNIKRFTSSPEKEKVLESKEMYERLKETELYTEEGSLHWYGSMNSRREVEDYNHSIDRELAGVLVEALFNKKAAKEKYEKLKETSFYSEDSTLWYQPTFNYSREFYTSFQLWAILVESLFDRNFAEERYQKAKNFFYIKRLEQWYNFLMIDTMHREHRNDDCLAQDQLLGILVEAIFSKEQAKKHHEKWKATALYNKDTRQWNEKIDKYGTLVKLNMATSTQFLGILAEALSDKETARKDYTMLKKTSLYNPKEKLWHPVMIPGQNSLGEGEGFTSYDQLLAILVQHTLYEEDDKNFETNAYSLPKIKKFY